MKWLIYKSEFVFQIRGPANKHGAKTVLTGRGNEMFTDGWGGEDDTRHSFGLVGRTLVLLQNEGEGGGSESDENRCYRRSMWGGCCCK